MKVTCERCGTEYNFDDAKVTEDPEGIKVKCTRCEHVFRIRKRSFLVTEPASSSSASQPGAVTRLARSRSSTRSSPTLPRRRIACVPG